MKTPRSKATGRLGSVTTALTIAALSAGYTLFTPNVNAQVTAAVTAPTSVSEPLDATAATSMAALDVTSGSTPSGAPSPTSSVTCSEHVPSGKERPLVEERFPDRANSGHAVALVLKLTHGKGERVLADSFEFQSGSDGAAALRRAGFEFPAKGSPATPKVERSEEGNIATTVVTLNVVPLPNKSGQHSLTLPPLPIAVARPSGEVMTLCSSSHAITVDDPTANVPNALPKRHPGPERQQELWVMLRNLVYGALIGLLLAAILAFVFVWYRRRPKTSPPPPPPRPAWEIALQELQDIRHADLIPQGRLTAHLERVNHTLRAYLGRSYNFDGLESTTEEVLKALQSSGLPKSLYAQTETMLRDSDLVKFAKIQPTEAQCHGALDDVEKLVKQTMHDERSVAAIGDAEPAPAIASLRPRDTGASKPTSASNEEVE